MPEVLADQRERRKRPYRHSATTDWHRRLHEIVDAHWPCPWRSEFRSIWGALVQEMETRGVQLGRASFGGWDDGDQALVEAAYCLTRTLRPGVVIETGVGHGITTRFILEGLEQNGYGRLCSIDLPPLLTRDLTFEVAVAVPAGMRDRWTLRRGSSRRVLTRLLDEVGAVDMFVHDSLHTGRNVSFELAHVWRSLDPGGAVVVDDVDYNRAFTTFAARTPGSRAVIGEHADGRGLFGTLVKTDDR